MEETEQYIERIQYKTGNQLGICPDTYLYNDIIRRRPELNLITKTEWNLIKNIYKHELNNAEPEGEAKPNKL